MATLPVARSTRPLGTVNVWPDATVILVNWRFQLLGGITVQSVPEVIFSAPALPSPNGLAPPGPDGPVGPGMPCPPDGPEGPLGPTPAGPDGPGGPLAPAPVRPVGPVTPLGPRGPVAP